MIQYKVGIVTRTKDRPLMLKRAARSVIDQTFKDFIWVIVNDGGDREAVDRIAGQAQESGVAIKVIHHSTSNGRPAAANRGIEACDAEYALLHDDDDTIDPTFLEKCVTFLGNESRYFNGVVVFSDIVEETLDGDSIRLVKVRSGYRPSIISFANLYGANLFPPIAFLFSRQAWAEVGKFNEALNYSEDWFFNQQYLSRFSIGILPVVLAHYHIRASLMDPSDIYSNTVVAGANDHRQHREDWTNRLIREDIVAGRLGLGQLNLYGQLFSKLEEVQSSMSKYDNGLEFLSDVGWIYRKIKRLLRPKK